jgi:phosphate/sulfate permease
VCVAIIIFSGVVTIVFVSSVIVPVSLATVLVSVVVGSELSFPPQEVKKNTMAAQNSRPANLDRFIDFDF